MKRTRGQRVNDFLIRHIPTPILLNPERVAIKGATLLSGAATLAFVQPTSLAALLPTWVVYLWAAAWFLGGVFGLVGYWRSIRAVEMAGHQLILLGAVVYGLALGLVVGATALVAIILVGVIAGCSGVRILVATGSRHTRRSGR